MHIGDKILYYISVLPFIAYYFVLKATIRDGKTTFWQRVVSVAPGEIVWATLGTLLSVGTLVVMAMPLPEIGASVMLLFLVALIPWLFITKVLLELNFIQALNLTIYSCFISLMFFASVSCFLSVNLG